MTKRKGIVSKVVLVLVVLTLISGCFVGTTLARYARAAARQRPVLRCGT